MPAFVAPTAAYAPRAPPATRLNLAATCYGPVAYHPSSSVRLHRPSLFPACGGAPPRAPPPAAARRPDRPDGAPPRFLCAFAALWRRYNASLARAPLLTKAASASVLVLLSDVCAQLLSGTADASRLLRFAAYGFALSGPIGHFWFSALERFVPVPGAAGVLVKVALDQLLLAPFATALFFAVMKTAEGSAPRDTTRFLADNMSPTMRLNYKLWPLANVVNFACVPPAHRVVFTSFVSIFWVSVLSLVSNRPTGNAVS